MPKRNRQKDRETFFWMKTPVIIIIGLGISILPALAIINKSELGWYRVVGALILCAICIGTPIAAREITFHSDRKNETHRPASNDPKCSPRSPHH